MLAVADFLDTLLRGAALGSLALALGGVAWMLAVLRLWEHRVPQAAVGLALVLVSAGAVALALAQTALVALKVFVLSEVLGPGALGDFVATAHFVAGAVRTLLALALASAAVWLRRAPAARVRFMTVIVLAVLLAASSAWLTHAVGRLEAHVTLMVLSVLHQVAASAWLGGLVQLGCLWWLARRAPAVRALWPELVARFSRLALSSVIVLLLAALPMTWMYTGSASGLVGTGYGALVLTKALLLGAALLLAAGNFATVRGGPGHVLSSSRGTRLPYLVEAETILLVLILFTAASLSAQPPSVDQAPAHQASLREVVEVFRPKIPSLRTPSVQTMRRDRGGSADGSERSRDAYLWSNFSHNVAGLILLGMSLVAVGGLSSRGTWGRHWPLGFVALAAFIYLRAAANEGTWPFGSVSLQQLGGEGLQHRIAAVLVLALGLLEWRARARPERGGLLPYVFPALGAVGAVLLLTHSHVAFQPKPSYLVQVTHTTMGGLAALLAAARWLELRLAPPARRWAGMAASVAMLMIALVLVFYREANVVIPPD